MWEDVIFLLPIKSYCINHYKSRNNQSSDMKVVKLEGLSAQNLHYIIATEIT